MSAVLLEHADTIIRKDEPCWRWDERNLNSDTPAGFRRYACVWVIRADEPICFKFDLGPAWAFAAPEFTMPCLLEHTVAEAEDIARTQRIGNDYLRKRLNEISATSTLIGDYLNQLEEKWKIINNQTVLGPGLWKQRTGFSKKGAREWRQRQTLQR